MIKKIFISVILMAIFITGIVGSVAFVIGTVIGFVVGDRRRTDIEADRMYDELIRYYETNGPQEDPEEKNIVM